MAESASRFRRAAVRETAILVASAAGSFLFFAHQSFEPPIAFRWMAVAPWAFVMLTAVVYLFLRMLFLVGGMFYPTRAAEFVLCPECGRLYDDSIPGRSEEHHRITLTPKPTAQEVLAAVMLRKAIDDARRSARRSLAGREVEMVEPPAEIENPPIDINEFERILRDLDFPDRKRRGPPDRRPKGPPEFPR